MQQTSSLYRELLSGNYWTENRLAIGDLGRLVTRKGEVITFGGTSILVAASGADGGYDESHLVTVMPKSQVFSGSEPAVGCCVSGEIDAEMLKPAAEFTGLSRIAAYTRLTDGTRYSEWIPQGVYFLDSMEYNVDDTGVTWLTIHGYDAMMFAEQDYPASSGLDWPAKDIDVVNEIAAAMNVSVDSRTAEIMTAAYPVQYPAQYSCREVLGYIAAMYAGCFIMTESGELRLVCLWDIPAETRYLIDSTGYAITFGGDRILV